MPHSDPVGYSSTRNLSNLHDGALSLDVGDYLSVEVALLVDTHLVRKGGSWLPLGGCSWSCLLHHAVDLLEGQTLGFWDEEVGVDEAKSAEGAPDEEDWIEISKDFNVVYQQMRYIPLAPKFALSAPTM